MNCIGMNSIVAAPSAESIHMDWCTCTDPDWSTDFRECIGRSCHDSSHPCNRICCDKLSRNDVAKLLCSFVGQPDFCMCEHRLDAIHRTALHTDRRMALPFQAYTALRIVSTPHKCRNDFSGNLLCNHKSELCTLCQLPHASRLYSVGPLGRASLRMNVLAID